MLEDKDDPVRLFAPNSSSKSLFCPIEVETVLWRDNPVGVRGLKETALPGSRNGDLKLFKTVLRRGFRFTGVFS